MAEVLFASQGVPPMSTVVSMTPVASGKKSLIIKIFIILFEHLWEVVTYRYIFAFKFHFKVSAARYLPPAANFPPVSLIPVVPLACDYIREFSKKFETVIMGTLGLGGN
jgi:hypothetical protein